MSQVNTHRIDGGSERSSMFKKILNNVIRLPYSNPMCFKSSGQRRVWEDSEEKEFSACYTQRWAESDILSFQFSWENYHRLSLTTDFTVKFVVNGVVAKQATFSATQNQTYSGHLYDEFVVRKSTGDYVSGMYAFSNRISEIKVSGNRIINIGDEFVVVITDMRGTVWTSNTMLCTDNLEGTKLFHYKTDCGYRQSKFDTFWGYMVNGYDLRLEAGYTDLSSVSDMTLFDTYTGGKEMIRSMPKECVTLNIGDNATRIPRDFFRVLNVFLCCDEKTIDGVDVEVSEGTFDISREAGVFNDKYAVPLVLRWNRHSYSSEVENEILEFFVIDENDNSATVYVESSVGWYLDINDVMNDVVFNRISGNDGSYKIEVRFEPNTSGSDMTYDIPLKRMDGSVKGTIQIVSKSVVNGGLGYMKIGDTFKVK